ncbi:MAG: J domain-containing protein [Planctomycetaceae bacterium]|nr:J domain-containing protein [Planctomycetaceae bacterium]
MLTVHYHTLGLSPDCSEADLRKRYLTLVRRYPPETHPDKFSKIHEAYEYLKNPLESIPDMLFSLTTEDTIDRIIADVIDDVRNERLPTSLLLQMGEQ